MKKLIDSMLVYTYKLFFKKPNLYLNYGNTEKISEIDKKIKVVGIDKLYTFIYNKVNCYLMNVPNNEYIDGCYNISQILDKLTLNSEKTYLIINNQTIDQDMETQLNVNMFNIANKSNIFKYIYINLHIPDIYSIWNKLIVKSSNIIKLFDIYIHDDDFKFKIKCFMKEFCNNNIDMINLGIYNDKYSYISYYLTYINNNQHKNTYNCITRWAKQKLNAILKNQNEYTLYNIYKLFENVYMITYLFYLMIQLSQNTKRIFICVDQTNINDLVDFLKFSHILYEYHSKRSLENTSVFKI